MNLNFDLKIDGLVKDKINITFGPYIPFSNFSNSPSSPSDFRSCKEERISKPESMNFKIYPIVLSPSFNLNTSPPLTENLFSFAISGSSPNTLVSGPVFTISPNFTTKTLGHIPKSGIEGSNILLEKSSLAPSPQENVKMPYFPIKSENLKSKNSVVSNFPIFKSSYFTPSPLFFSNPCYTFSKMNTTNKFDNKSTLPARKRYLPYHMNKTGNKLVLGSYTSNFVPRLSNGEISQMPLDQRKKYYHRLVCDNPECVHDKPAYSNKWYCCNYCMTRAHNVRRSKARTTLRQSRVMARTEFDKAIDEGLEGRALEAKRQELIDRLIMRGDDGEKKKVAEIAKMEMEHQVTQKMECRNQFFK